MMSYATARGLFGALLILIGIGTIAAVILDIPDALNVFAPLCGGFVISQGWRWFEEWIGGDGR